MKESDFTLKKTVMSSKKKFGAVLVSMGLVASMAVFTSTPAHAASDTLIVGMSADLDYLDPAKTMDNAQWKITYPCYQRLVEYNGAKTDVVPGLAKSWKVSADQKIYTFTLNPGNKFADGTEVTAAAVKYSFDRMMKLAAGPDANFDQLSKVNVISTYVVEFVQKAVSPQFLYTLAGNYGGIVNPAAEAKGADTYLASHTMGSGAYQLTEWVKGQYIKLGLNPNYKGATPALKTVIFKIVGDVTAQRLQLSKGEIDIAEGIPTDQLKDVAATSGITLVNKPSLTVDYMYINNSKGKEVLKNAAVRQAISYAIDYDGLIKVAAAGYGTQMRGPIPTGMWGQNTHAYQYKYNPGRAKSLLAHAGVKNLSLDLMYSARRPWWAVEAQFIQASAAKAGIQINLKLTDYATSRQLMFAGNFDLALGLWSPDYADPFMFMNLWFDSANFGASGNRSFYNNPVVDDLLKKAVATTNQAKRTVLYRQAQAIVIKDAAYVYMYQKNFLLPMSSSVKGYVFNPMLEQIYNLSGMSKA
jgi:peptide/nickel transport system substrate-binding protein